MPHDDQTTQDERDATATDTPRLAQVLLPLLADVALPVAAYYVARTMGAGAFLAMLAGTGVASLRVVFVALRARKLDGFAGFLAAVFATGLAVSFLTGDARFLLAKDSAITGVAGLIFLGTCIAGRPIVFYSAKQIVAKTPARAAVWETRWRTEPAFRRSFIVMSLVWGLGLLFEATTRIPLVYLVPLDVMAGISAAMLATTFVLLSIWNVRYVRRLNGKNQRARLAATSGSD